METKKTQMAIAPIFLSAFLLFMQGLCGCGHSATALPSDDTVAEVDTEQIDANDISTEQAFGGIIKKQTNKEGKDFEFMYDTDTDHPWSSYVTEDSMTVLKLEKVYEDSFGVSIRVLVFEPEYWYKGTFHYPELGFGAAFVGYGTCYVPHPDYIDFPLIDKYTDSDLTYFVLSGYRSNWDSILVGNMRPPIYGDEDIKECVFKKQSWDEISKWWKTKQRGI